MLSIQEMVQKTVEQRKQVRQTLGSGVFHPDDASILDNQKPADYHALKESLRHIPLSEFLAKSGTTGIAGAAYLVADKLHDQLVFYSKQTDKVPVISAYVAERWAGGDLKVPVIDDHSYKPQMFSGGYALPVATMETMQPSLVPKSFGLPMLAGLDLVEDGQWDMVEFHVGQAGKAMGVKATSLAIEVLGTATDGWGTVNGGSSGDAGETKWMGATIGISEAIDANLVDGRISNTIVTSGQPWTHSISETLPAGSTFLAVKEGFTHCVNNMDILLHTNATDLTNSSSKLETIVFDRFNALLTGRKRWMQIENYGNPIADLAGAVVTSRQDSVTLYDDSICVIAET